MWTEHSLIEAAVGSLGRHQVVHMLPQVDVERRRIDAMLVLNGMTRVAVEAKVSRADFRREDDEKRAPSYRAAHHCVYLCPAGLIEPDEVPSGWGLWWVHGDGKVAWVAPSERHEPDPQAVDLLATRLIERAATLRLLTERPGQPATLYAEIERYQASLATRDAALVRERGRAQHANEQVLAALGDQVCGECREPIRYMRTARWAHVDKTREASCRDRRAERERLRREAATGAKYVVGHVPPIVPADLSTDH